MVFAPFHLVDGHEDRAMFLTADHASRALPASYGSLGLDEAQFERHIAYDIGVEGVTRRLAELLEVPAILGGFSRLLIDPNRGEDDPTLIMQLSDGAVISGNYPLDEQEREKRLTQFYRPYHDALSDMSARVMHASNAAPLIVSIHSFTPTWKGQGRPWHIGLLWDKDDRVAKPLLEMLMHDENLIVGDNEPYDGALRHDAMFRHGTFPGYPHILIEIRQDLIADHTGVEEWALRLAPLITAINTLPGLHEVKKFGSRTDNYFET